MTAPDRSEVVAFLRSQYQRYAHLPEYRNAIRRHLIARQATPEEPAPVTTPDLDAYELKTRQLLRDHEDALHLLGEIIGTLRLPANVALLAGKIPEASPIIASWCRRYQERFERAGK
jgi:hypothetical protein